ncbi:MAG: HU family DNA-binding protein [Patescibacteria group bacterium]
MTKTEITEALAEEIDMTKADAKRAVDGLIGIIQDTVARGEKVTLTGFGTFEQRHRKARMGRNPRTGAPLHIPASDYPAFRAGKNFKEAVE